MVDHRIDAVLQITSSGLYVASDPVNSVLSGNCGHVQGWRVHPTTIFDESAPAPPGTQVPHKQTLWINQRIDGTTPEFYNRNWYIHAGHLDGTKPRARSRGERYNPKAGMGEESFDRWPPRLVQDSSWRVL